MSKIGKKTIQIPQGVTVAFDAPVLTVTGPKGSVAVRVDHAIQAIVEPHEVRFEPAERLSKRVRSLWGTTTALVLNAVLGVTKGYEKKLEIEGVGFRATKEGNALALNIGFSHPIKYDPPTGIEITVEKNVITICGNDKGVVGQTAAKIRAFKKPEPYKGKGIHYQGEIIRRKAGKKAAASAK